MWSQLVAQVLPALIDALTPILVAALVGIIYRWTGIQIEQKHMLALQSALQNGARLLLSGKSLEDAIDYVEGSVPDALAKLKVEDRFRIEELLAPHIAALPHRPTPLTADHLAAFRSVIGMPTAGGIQTDAAND